MIQNMKKRSDFIDLNKYAYKIMLAGTILGSIGLFTAWILSMHFTEINQLNFENQQMIIEIATVSVTIFAEFFLSGIVLNRFLDSGEKK